MRHRKFLFAMALASACFAVSNAQGQGSTSGGPSPATRSGHIGDSVRTLGEIDPTELSGGVDQRPAHFREAGSAIQSNPSLASASANTGRISSDDVASWTVPSDPAVAIPSSTYLGQTHHADVGVVCGTACRPAPPRFWAEADTLLWFSETRNTPALVTNNVNAGGLPVIGEPGASILAGGPDPIGTDLLTGYRFGGGMWLDHCQTLGVGARAFGFYDGSSSQTFSSSGTPSLGVPFFNTSLGIPDAYLVAFDAGTLGKNNGSVTVANDLELLGVDIYLRRALMRTGCSRVDLVGGYLYTEINDSLTLDTRLVDGITNSIPNGTVFRTTDRFTGENVFQGGTIGLQSEHARRRWRISSAARFGLGDMEQTVRVAGSYSEAQPSQPIVTANRGLFAQKSNIGTATRNQFAFVPMLDFKLGYQLCRSARFDVGYGMMYFSDVALAGNQIDTNIDIFNILGTPTAPQPQFVNDSLLLHGVTLGLTLTF